MLTRFCPITRGYRSSTDVPIVAWQALSGIFTGIGGRAPTTRTYYIEAEEGVWDYSPSNQFMCGAQPRAFQGKEVRPAAANSPVLCLHCIFYLQT